MTFDALTDIELADMRRHAAHEAERDYRDVENCRDATIRPLLVAAAQSANTFWRTLRAEEEHRRDVAIRATRTARPAR